LPTRTLRATLVAVGLLALSAPASAQPWFEGRSRAAAESWLETLDAGRYEEAWEAAAVPFRDGKSKPEWMRQQKDRAEQSGPLSGRAFVGSLYTPSHRFSGTDVDVTVEELTYASLDQKQGRWVEHLLMVRQKGTDGPWMVYSYECRLRTDGPAAPP
jgi:hypothetical protein